MNKPLLTQAYTQLPNDFYQRVAPEPLEDATLLIQNEALLRQLDCDITQADLQAITAGQLDAYHLTPIAQKYVGHQFGFYNPNLGDGRGLLLGQWRDANHHSWDFHLKGAGRTPFSRQGDGRAVLRSTIREFLASEALFGLGIPTTRALSIATSTERVQREILEPRATLIRVTSSHIRFGHFQWAAGEGKGQLHALLNFVIAQHFPQWLDLSQPNQAKQLFNHICVATARLMAHWKAVGFNHGVMNTDNMSILGETFDFGPYAFLDDYQADFVCNHSDYEGRYGFNQQANVGLWNCKVLGSTFSDWLDASEIETCLQNYVSHYHDHYLTLMMRRLGLDHSTAEDMNFIIELLEKLHHDRIDYSLFFRRLALWQTDEASDFFKLLPHSDAFTNWLSQLEKRIAKENITQAVWRDRICQRNPSILLRNHIAQEIITACEQGDSTPLHTWLDALQSPFEPHLELADYQRPPQANQKGLQLSCSS